MLYPKNSAKVLDKALFERPTSEYRGTPFWAWNTNLKKDELLWQIERFKEMGLGGYHMHVRAGMNTEYLSDGFMDLIAACVEKGKEEEMLAWLYDEDRWPSGAAGGFVTKEPRFRQKYITFSTEKDENATDPETGHREGRPYLVGAYDVTLNEKGELERYARIGEDDTAEGSKVYAYLRTPAPDGWYNDQTYVDTLDKEAMKKFIDITYTAYKNKIGKEFGKTVPAIFTDEPQFWRVTHMKFAKDLAGASYPWTRDFDPSFRETHGYSIVDRLPEVFLNLKDGKPSKARYDYFDHLSELFANAFADQCGAWCSENGIALTGHLMEEAGLCDQLHSTGESMRSYRSFGIPGIDMLCDQIELSTAKQTQSAVHQYGKEGMLSELYGVTGWAFDFRGHKFQGDWQAALGVTVRVPHLSWVSMKGSAKRDYPASIHYQSAWYKKYGYVEDHFARLNTALTRGTPDVKIGVIHPIESQWLNYGPNDTCSADCASLEQAFQNLVRYLLFSQLDFDFIAESLLPELYGGCADRKIKVGKMSYSAIVVPSLRTLRKTTVDALSEFVDNGGLLLFTGDCPDCLDGELSDYARALYEKANKCSFTKLDVADALESVRDITLTNAVGAPVGCYIYNMRNDGDGKWLFLARSEKYTLGKIFGHYSEVGQELKLKVKGHFKPTVYDTLSGEIKEISYRAENGYTTLSAVLFSSDSLLLRLDTLPEGEPSSLCLDNGNKKNPTRVIDFKEKVAYKLAEPNVKVLDICRYSFDGVEYSEKEEMLRIDMKIRKRFNWPKADGHDCQPWAIEGEKVDTFVYLKFEFDSEVAVPCKLAFEEAREVCFNGENVPVVKNGWFTDKEIYTMDLPDLKVGKNTLVVRAPISKRISIENMFILGDFGVRAEGCEATITKRADTIAFGSITSQGLPFYGAAITYELPVTTGECDLRVISDLYEGAVIDVKLDGKDAGNIAYSPYAVEIKDVAAGEHTVSLTLYTTRINTFGALHNCIESKWKGPNMYYSVGTTWAYEYQLKAQGILKSPLIEVFEK